MCGIAGFFGKPKKIFNLTILNYLLMAQDSRGKDNTGIVYSISDPENPHCTAFIRRTEDERTSGGEDLSTFTKIIEKEGKFWPRDKKPNFHPVNSWVLGHSRSASRGGSGIKNAHPFVCSDNDENPTRTVIGVHNGTITNEYELERKFGVNLPANRTDSELLFTIMAKGEEETLQLLKSYRGSAALVWYVKEEPNRMYVWTGKDSGYLKTSERSLHYIQTKHGLYISSEFTPIEKIILATPNWKSLVNSDKLNVWHFAMDAITVIENGVIKEIHEVKRENSFTSSYSGGVGIMSKKNESDLSVKNGSCASSIIMGKDGIEALSKKVFETDTIGQIDLFDLISDNRLGFSKGLYHFGGNIAHTNVQYLPELSITGDVEHACFIVTDQYFDFAGREIIRNHAGKWVYNDEFHTTAEGITPHTLYFYKGILVKSKDHLINIHQNTAVNNGVDSATVIRQSTEYPIWVGRFVNTITEQGREHMITFSPPNVPGKESLPLNGLVVWPYVRKGYVFSKNYVVDILSGERLQKIVNEKQVHQTRYCFGCKTSIVQDCIMCSKEEDNEDDYTPTGVVLRAFDDYLGRVSELENKVAVICDDCGCTSNQYDEQCCTKCGSLNIEVITSVGNKEPSNKIKTFFEQ